MLRLLWVLRAAARPWKGPAGRLRRRQARQRTGLPRQRLGLRLMRSHRPLVLPQVRPPVPQHERPARCSHSGAPVSAVSRAQEETRLRQAGT